MTTPDQTPRPRRRRSFWSRLAHDVGWISTASGTGTRIERDAVHQYGDEGDSGPGLFAGVPGWLLLVLLGVIVIGVLFFTSR